MKSAILIFAAVMMIGCASASTTPKQPADVPPPDTSMVATWPATLQKPPATQLMLGSLRIRFGETTLQDVVKAVGAGRIAHRGDAGDSITWLCYTVPDGKSMSRLWLVSGEIDGGKYVTGVTAKRLSSQSPAIASCPMLPVASGSVALDYGIWIGTSGQQLRAIFGNASHAAKDWRMYDFSRTFKTTGCDEAQQYSSLWVRLKNGRVIEIEAYQTVTC